MKASIVVILFCMFTGSNARSSNCPTPQWFVAEFVGNVDQVVSPPIVILDSSLWFFRDVMRLTEKEIAQVEEDAIQFFNTRFGLNFSQSEPDEWGRRFYQNATFLSARFSPEVRYAVTFNRWIVSGDTKSVCFESHYGAFRVEISGEQILHGTYGGEEGILAGPTEALSYGYYYIPVFPQEPLVIQYTTATPGRLDRDGFQVANLDLFHRYLGRGLTQGILRYIPTEDGRVHFTLRDVFTFPAHPTFFP